MNLETRVYWALLKLYPREFREKYGEEMTRVFQENLASEGSSCRFWVGVIHDVVSSAPRERFSLRGRNRIPQIGIKEVGVFSSLVYATCVVVAVVFPSPRLQIVSPEISVLLPIVMSVAVGRTFKIENEIDAFGFRLTVIELVLWTGVSWLLPSFFFGTAWGTTLGFGTTMFGFPVGLLVMGLAKIRSIGFKKMPPISIILCLAAVANFTLNAVPFLFVDGSFTNQSFSLKHELWLNQMNLISTWVWLVIQFLFSLGLAWTMFSSRKSSLPLNLRSEFQNLN